PSRIPYPPRIKELKVSKLFKIAFIGAGGIAHTHVNHLKKVEGVHIVAASDVSEKSLTKFGETFGVTRLFSDYKEMLKDIKDADAVSVCTPNGLHAENAIAALEAGKH